MSWRRTPKHLRKILSIEGQISPAECELLYELAGDVSSGCIVEIGSYRGRSTAALALGSQTHHHVPVYAIEPHEAFTGVMGGDFGPKDRAAFFKNMLRVKITQTVRLVNLSSEVLRTGWDKQIALLWIDGDHSYQAVKRDFQCWEPFLTKGALLALHDSINPSLGATQLIAEVLATGSFKKVRQVGVTTVLQKT